MQVYSNPKREADPHALPDAEVFYLSASDIEQIKKDNGISPDDDTQTEDWIPENPGWYYHYCFPGCIPDGDMEGPFTTEDEAIADLRANNDDEEEV